MGKKKFIDKKKSATFQLMARDTSDPYYSSDPSGDRVFVRVDNNQYAPDIFNDGEPHDEMAAADPDSICDDAPEDCSGDDANAGVGGLPDHVRKEIIELGFPDDGYNYLIHLREIKNVGGGSAYFENPKANFDRLPPDVKAYDASRVDVSKTNDVSEDEKNVYSVASKTVGVRLQKVLDPEVVAMLDDSDYSKCGSDIEDLEEDFVVRANVMGAPVGEKMNETTSFPAGSGVVQLHGWNSGGSGAPASGTYAMSVDIEKPRERRALDEQFDLLELNEYGPDSEEESDGYFDDDDECQDTLQEKLSHTFQNRSTDLVQPMEAEDEESPELTAEVIHRCREYAENYENEDDHDEENLIDDESTEESEVWDCETIISTYSTLDNHPGKIAAPEARRKKKLAEAILGASSGTNAVITLKGKERLPVDFLPRNKKHGEEKIKEAKVVIEKKIELSKKKSRAQESKEEKKARKSTVKSEKREARQVKKEMKGLYKSEAHRAQKVAAITGPSSIHLMLIYHEGWEPYPPHVYEVPDSIPGSPLLSAVQSSLVSASLLPQATVAMHLVLSSQSKPDQRWQQI